MVEPYNKPLKSWLDCKYPDQDQYNWCMDCMSDTRIVDIDGKIWDLESHILGRCPINKEARLRRYEKYIAEFNGLEYLG